MTGNTVIDTLYKMVETIEAKPELLISSRTRGNKALERLTDGEIVLNEFVRFQIEIFFEHDAVNVAAKSDYEKFFFNFGNKSARSSRISGT